MCQRVTCNQCSKPTFAGCGMHVEQVLRDVPPDDRCRCRDVASKAGKPQPRARAGWWPF